MTKTILIPDKCYLCRFSVVGEVEILSHGVSDKPIFKDLCVLYNDIMLAHEQKPDFCKAKTVTIEEDE